jgi:hypothetical protein
MEGSEKFPSEKDAKTYRLIWSVVFAALLLSVFLPDPYSLFYFALPVGAVSFAFYYWQFRKIANFETGTLLTLILVGLLSFQLFRSGYQWRQAADQVERIVCNSDADAYSEMQCSEVYAVLNPEPAYSGE